MAITDPEILGEQIRYEGESIVLTVNVRDHHWRRIGFVSEQHPGERLWVNETPLIAFDDLPLGTRVVVGVVDGKPDWTQFRREA